jgi:hypothetical protein
MRNTNRILFNTSVMYLKMFITITLALYILRVVPAAIGIIAFGLFSVVVSVVDMFGFLNKQSATGLPVGINMFLLRDIT